MSEEEQNLANTLHYYGWDTDPLKGDGVHDLLGEVVRRIALLEGRLSDLNQAVDNLDTRTQGSMLIGD